MSISDILKRKNPYTLRQKLILGTTAAAFTLFSWMQPAKAYPMTAANDQNKQTTSQTQDDKKAIIPEFRIATYDSNHNLVTDVKDMQGANLKSPPRIVPCNGSFEITDNKGSPIIYIKNEGKKLSLDMLIREFNDKTGKPGDYLINPKPEPGRGPRAFPASIDVKEYGLKEGKLHVAFPAIEDGKTLLSSVPIFFYTEKCCEPQITIVEKLVEKKVPVERIVEKEKIIKEKSSMILGLYANQDLVGVKALPFKLDIGENAKLYAGIFGEYLFEKSFENNLQYDEYLAKARTIIIGRTDAESKTKGYATGIELDLLFGKEGELRWGVGAAAGYESGKITNRFIQTAKDKATGNDVKAPVICEGEDGYGGLVLKINGQFYVPLSDNSSIGIKVGMRKGPEKTLSYSEKNITLEEGGFKPYAGINVMF